MKCDEAGGMFIGWILIQVNEHVMHLRGALCMCEIMNLRDHV